jgi:hypothetical protein
MPVDPDVQSKLDEISQKIDDLAEATRSGEFVLPLGLLGLTDSQANDVKLAMRAAAKQKLQQLGLSPPVVAGTWGYSR